MKPIWFRILGLGAAAGLLTFAGVALAQHQHHDRSDMQSSDMHSSDAQSDMETEQQVLSRMHDVNQMEISMGEMAMHKAHSKAVRDFANRLRKDHEANDREVTSVAERLGVDLRPTGPGTPEERAQADRDNRTQQRLESAHGRDFDREFVRAMAKGHDDVDRMLHRARNEVHDRRVRDLVNSTIPAVEHHRNMARNLQSRV